LNKAYFSFIIKLIWTGGRPNYFLYFEGLRLSLYGQKNQTVMRKICLLAVAAMFIQVSFGQAQFGLKTGFSLIHLNTSGSNDYSFKSMGAGFTVGATVDLKLADNFFVQPELDYDFHSLHESFYSLSWKYSYFNIPVLFKYRFTNSPVGLYAGPQLGFLIKATSTLKDTKTDIKGDLTNTDFSGVGGIDFKLDNGVRFDLRFQQSAFNLVKVEFDNPLKTRQQIFSFSVGYVFKSAKKANN
jgi:hypothetical protein